MEGVHHPFVVRSSKPPSFTQLGMPQNDSQFQMVKYQELSIGIASWVARQTAAGKCGSSR
jgi:hypothetical protein